MTGKVLVGWVERLSESPPPPESDDLPRKTIPEVVSWLEAAKPQLPGSPQVCDRWQAGTHGLSSGCGCRGLGSGQRLPWLQAPGTWQYRLSVSNCHLNE